MQQDLKKLQKLCLHRVSAKFANFIKIECFSRRHVEIRVCGIFIS